MLCHVPEFHGLTLIAVIFPSVLITNFVRSAAKVGGIILRLLCCKFIAIVSEGIL